MASLDFLVSKFGLNQINTDVYAGKFQNYNMIVSTNLSGEYKLSLQIGAFKPDSKSELLKLLSSTQYYQDAVATVIAACAVFHIKSSSNSNISEAQILENIIENIIPLLKKNGYHSGSFKSGIDDGNVQIFQVAGEYKYLTFTEFSNAYNDNAMLKEEKPKASKQRAEISISGMVATGLFAILITFSYMIAFKLDIIAFLIPLCTVPIATIVYKMVSGKLNTTVIKLLFIEMLPAVPIGWWISFSLVFFEIEKLRNSNVKFWNSARETFIHIRNSADLRDAFSQKLIFSLVLLLVGAIASYIYITKSQSEE